jgi:hypothetical protein
MVRLQHRHAVTCRDGLDGTNSGVRIGWLWLDWTGLTTTQWTISLGLRILTCQRPKAIQLLHRMDVNTIMASRYCIWSLSRRHTDTILGHRHVPRLRTDKLARYSHGHRCHHLGLGLEHLGFKVHAHLSKRHAGRPCIWILSHHHRLLGSVAKGYNRDYLHAVSQCRKLEFHWISAHGRAGFRHLRLHLYV